MNTVLRRLFVALPLALFAIAKCHAAAPALVSVTPTDGATQVATTSPIVFVFDQDMDTSGVLFQSGPGYTGAFSVTATGFNQTLIATWGADKRTLTIAPIIQFPYATFTWTLNPDGPVVLARIKSASGADLPMVSGTFTTGVAPQGPKLVSSNPLNNAQNVLTNSRVEFRFDLAMKKLTAAELNGNPPAAIGAIAWTNVDAQKFTYSWSPDGKTLFCAYTGGLPPDELISWALNPTGAAVKFESETSMALATDNFKGSFFTAGPESSCFMGAVPVGWGAFSIFKGGNYNQTPDTDPAASTNGSPFFLSASVQNSVTGGALSGVSLTLPDGTTTNMQVFSTVASLFRGSPDRNALNATNPPGDYVLRFTQAGQPERVITMTMPEDTAPVPKITNLAEAQSINPAADFTFHWNQYTGAGEKSYISLLIIDPQSRIVFRAPNPCVPRTLSVNDTSAVVPAGLLQPNVTYTGNIQFGNLFYFDTNAVPSMTGSGNVALITLFTLKTIGGTTSVVAAKLIDQELLPNGNPQFRVTGTIAHVYAIERTSILPPSWSEIATVTIEVGGNATFEDTEPNKTFPLYYRAVAK